MQHLGRIYIQNVFVVYLAFGVTGHPVFYLASLLIRLAMAWHLPAFLISSPSHLLQQLFPSIFQALSDFQVFVLECPGMSFLQLFVWTAPCLSAGLGSSTSSAEKAFFDHSIQKEPFLP